MFQLVRQQQIRTWRYDGAVIALDDPSEEPDVGTSGVNRLGIAAPDLASPFKFV